MRLNAAYQLLSLVLLGAASVQAIFQDEAGHIDFQHALLGAPVPKSTFFFQPTLSSKATLLYTISEKGVIGAINPKDGSLVWRQRQFTGGTCKQSFTGHLGGANGTNAIVSAYGDSISSWEAATGRMLWSFVEVGCIRSLVVPDIAGLTQDPIMVMDDDGLTKIISLNSVTGKLIWEVKDDAGDVPYAVTAGSSNVFYIALKPAMLKGYKIQVTTVNPTSARPIKQTALSSDGEVKGADNVIFVSPRAADPIVVWADKALKTLKINVLGTDDITTVKVPSSGKAVEKISVHASDDPTAKSYFLIQYETATSHWAEIYQIDKSKKTVKKTHDLPELDGDAVFAASNIKDNVFFSRLTQDEAILYFASTANILERWPASTALKELQTHGSGARHLAAEVVTRGTANYAIRGALVLGSDDLVQMRNGEVDWTRTESLAGVRAAAWAETAAAEDLARELAIESHNNPVSAYVHRLARHIKDLQYLPHWLQGLSNRVVRSLTGASLAGDTTESGDVDFGFRKLVVAATEKGRVVALDSGAHGQVVWTTQAAELSAGQLWNVTDIRIAADRVLVHADQGASVTLELGTGAIVDRKDPKASGPATRVVPVSTADGHSVLLQLSSEGVPEPNQAVALEDNTVVVTHVDNRTLAGWMMGEGKPARQVWSFAAPEDETIAATARRPAHDPVASIGHALGDRNVLYKYLNPNIMLIVTTHATASTLAVHLLDTVNGQTLYRTEDTGVDPFKPITAAMSENWFAYSFFTDPTLSPSEPAMESSKGYVLTMSELFESPLPNDPGPLEDAANFSSLTGRPYIPAVISQSYTIPAPITYLTTTSTKQGITPRSLLAYSPSLSGILAIPVPLLSPRKPVGRDPTAAEREEGLLRYAPLLEFQPAWTVSHTRELLGIQGMVVTPTHMESTSLLFAYGELDLFGTQVAPIGSFDILGKGFGKLQLVLTIVALAIGMRVLAPMVQKKQIDGLWST